MPDQDDRGVGGPINFHFFGFTRRIRDGRGNREDRDKTFLFSLLVWVVVLGVPFLPAMGFAVAMRVLLGIAMGVLLWGILPPRMRGFPQLVLPFIIGMAWSCIILYFY